MPNATPARAKGASRRDVLKQAATLTAAAAVAGFPTIIPSSALGDETKAAPSNRLNLGFIGVGKMASGHLGFFRGRGDIQVVAICDVDKTRRETFVSETNKKYAELERKDVKPTVGIVDYNELLARKDIDAVVIGTPDHWHTAVLVAAANAKKHIYCEKPLTLTIAEAKLCIEAVQKNGVTMQTGSQQRSEGPFRDVVDYIRNGRLGKIKEVYVALGGTHSIPCDLPEEKPAAEIEWDRWLGPAPQRGYAKRLGHAGEMPNTYPFNPGWREFKEFSGGFVTDWGAHHIDITQWALSKDGDGPSEILPPEKADDQYGARLIYRGSPAGDEIVVHHVQTIMDAPDEKNPGKTVKQGNGILFVGEKGKIFVNRGQKVSDPAEILKTPLTDSDKKLPNTGQHRVNWLDCIKSKQLPVANVVVGAGSVTACHLVNLAYWHRQKMKWDAKAWKFADEAQNAWLTRERRGSYQLPTIA
ncbi:MAG TPA: Gfo/Idh/MocA family oxidoreductase [Humisphaera sp.]